MPGQSESKKMNNMDDLYRELDLIQKSIHKKQKEIDLLEEQEDKIRARLLSETVRNANRTFSKILDV